MHPKSADAHMGQIISPYTAKTQYQKMETNIPRKGITSLSPNIHIQMSVKDFYILRIGLPVLLQENMWTDSGNM
jgi:hypothetical protein